MDVFYNLSFLVNLLHGYQKLAFGNTLCRWSFTLLPGFNFREKVAGQYRITKHLKPQNKKAIAKNDGLLYFKKSYIQFF